MAPRSTKPAVDSSTIGKACSERLQLAQTITKIVSTQDAFLKAVETLKEFNEATLKNLDLEIDTKREELQRLEVEFATKRKDEQIKTEQELREFKNQRAVEILKNENQIPINVDELAQLRKRVAEAEMTLATELEKLRKEDKAAAESSMRAALSNMELKHKAEVAKLVAENEQRTNDIQNFKETIANLKTEISAQRELTRQVAESSRQAPISQQFGK